MVSKGGESDTLEFKRTTGERKEAAQSICAMLNHRGGKIVFGITPDGVVRGQQVVDKTLEDVAQEIKLIDPPAFPAVERVRVSEGMDAIVITVSTGQSGPYNYKGQAYKRVGNTSLAMSREEYNRVLLERMHSERRWENQPAEGWTLADLDAAEIVRTVDEGIRRGRTDDPGTREPGALLQGLGLRRGNEILRAAVVLFGRPEKTEAELPQCLLRVARFKGIDKTEFIDNRQFHGNAFYLLHHAERFLRENLPIAGRVVPTLFERIDDPLYPPAALREALANAFCHRDYTIGGGSVAVAIFDDRLEISSSGPLHFGLTAEQLLRPHESLPWNPLIARVFYRRGLVETWGRGTLKMIELSERAGMEHPEIFEIGGGVVVRFNIGPPIPPHLRDELSARQRRILRVLATHPQMALRDIQKTFSDALPDWSLKNDLETLKRFDLIEVHGRGRGARWRLRL